MSDSNSFAGGAFAPAMPATPASHRLAIRFTGSGSEYFRIWIVNLLLMLVTLGVYYPWAKVRRMRYFHGNTLVDGAPLDFHGNPVKMLKGYLLVGVMFVLYSAAGNFSPTAGFVALLIVTAIWPALLKSSMQFRLANTSWRGLRFRFAGSLEGAYRAMLPLFIPGIVMVAAISRLENPQGAQIPPAWYLGVFAVTALATLAVAPWLLWNLKQYQHRHYALASEQMTFKATAGEFYTLTFKLIGLLLLPLVLVTALVMVSSLGMAPGPGQPPPRALFVLLPFLVLLPTLLVFVVIKPYAVSRMQNLLWNRTGNAALRFRSDLRFKSMLWLTLKNWLLMIVTIGFYWPFAKVAIARLRVEAVAVETRVDPDTLVSRLAPAEGDAAGDAAGDLFGLDIGL